MIVIPNGELDGLLEQITEEREIMNNYFRDWQADIIEERIPDFIINEVINLINLGGITDILNRLTESPNNVSEFEIIVEMCALTKKIDHIDMRVNFHAATNNLSNQVVAAWSNLKSIIDKFLQSISAAIWNLLSKLLNPKGWSISGSVGANFIAFTGNVTMQIDF